jgi:hypothetical protein
MTIILIPKSLNNSQKKQKNSAASVSTGVTYLTTCTGRVDLMSRHHSLLQILSCIYD